jgi:hypothetical protein
MHPKANRGGRVHGYVLLVNCGSLCDSRPGVRVGSVPDGQSLDVGWRATRATFSAVFGEVREVTVDDTLLVFLESLDSQPEVAALGAKGSHLVAGGIDKVQDERFYASLGSSLSPLLKSPGCLRAHEATSRWGAHQTV